MAELRKLVKSRSGHRLHVRNTILTVNGLMDNNTNPTEEWIAKLNSAKITFEKQLRIIETLDEKIEDIIDEEEKEKEIVEKGEF